MITDLLVRYVLAHPRAEKALAAAVCAAIRSQPYLPGLGWFLGVFYGAFTLLCALSQWWAGAAVFAAGGALSGLCLRRVQGAARNLERRVAEQRRERAAVER